MMEEVVMVLAPGASQTWVEAEECYQIGGMNALVLDVMLTMVVRALAAYIVAFPKATWNSEIMQAAIEMSISMESSLVDTS